MEEDQPIQPDESGHLDLKYRGWTEVPFADLSSFAYCLQSLDVSFNQLQYLPDEFSSLRFLQILNCSCNKLRSPPESIGALESLTVLKANGNQLTAIPSSIGQCKSLQQLILSENILTSLPAELKGCSSLQKLLVQNNDLSRLPLSLAKLKDTLIEIDLSNNNEQMTVTIPTEVHRDIDSVMWIISLQSQKRDCIDGLKHDIKTLQHDIVGYEFDLLQLEEQVAMLEQKKRNIESDLEQVKHFLRAQECKRNVQYWMEQKWEEIKLACASKLPI